MVTNGSGSVTNANVTSVVVTCTTNKYTVGGTVTGLAAGDGIVLRDNGADNLSVSASGTFTFATPVASGAAYAVTVFSQSGVTAQTCTVSGGTGTVAGANVTSVTVNCTTNKYTIGGTVSGLAGTGLVLQDNGGDNLSITANGTFSFATPIASDAIYAVTVFTGAVVGDANLRRRQRNGDGCGSERDERHDHLHDEHVHDRGTISGLATNESVVLQDNGANNLTIGANGTFTFATPIPSGGAYSVTTLTNPASPITQTCAVTVGSGTVTNANITSVVVTCTANKYTIGGTASGVVGSVVLVTTATR